MSALDRLMEKAKASPAKIILPEGADPRILAGAAAARKAGIAELVLLGNPARISESAAKAAVDMAGLSVIDPKASEQRSVYAYLLMEIRKGKIADREAALARWMIPWSLPPSWSGQAMAMARLAGRSIQRATRSASRCK